MKIRLYSDKIFSDGETENHVFKTYVKEEGYEEKTVMLDHPDAKGSFREIYFDHFRIGIGDLQLAQKAVLDFESEAKMVEMYFSLEAEINIRSDSFEEDMNFSSHEQNIIFMGEIEGCLECGAGKFRIVEVDVDPTFFMKYAPESGWIYEKFLNKIKTGTSGPLARKNGLIDLEMHRIIQDILTCSRKGMYKTMFLESKIIELFLLQLEQLDEQLDSPLTIKSDDIDKLYLVRDFILENLAGSYSLVELARIAGTNEFTLKKGFKELFGTTVFGFWNDAKMDRAHKLLKDSDKTIKEIASLVGYKYPQHFTAAFKRKFGIVPSHMRYRQS